MKKAATLILILVGIIVHAQNDAYFLSHGGFDIMRIDMDSPKTNGSCKLDEFFCNCRWETA